MGSDPADASPGPAAADPESERRAEVRRAVESVLSGGNLEPAVRALFNAYYRPLQRFFLRKGFGFEDALDLTQETFLGIYRGLGGYRGDARIETWLFQVAARVYLKRLRTMSTAMRSGREIPHDDLAAADSEPAVGAGQLDEVIADERRRAMREAVRELPDKMRKCLTLRIYHQLSYAEIAAVMKLKIDTVKAHLFQARAKLKDRLARYSLDVLDR